MLSFLFFSIHGWFVLLLSISLSCEQSFATGVENEALYGDCGISLTKKYLSVIKKSESFTSFVPTVYYEGSSTKIISTKGDTFEYHLICVDGTETYNGEIQLYDDGTHGDDFAMDGVYSRGCVHFCADRVNLNDFFGYAMEDNNGAQARLIVMDASVKESTPYKTVDTPLTPHAKVIASSHAFFFADVQRKYYPDFPFSDSPNDFASPSGRNLIISALLQVFGDVFDFVTYTGLDLGHGAIGSGGINKWQFWDRRAGPSHVWGGFGLVDNECIIALNGVPPYRLVGVINTVDVIEEFTSTMNHELAHGVMGFEYHAGLNKARKGDNAHYDAACTGDHSSLQGPLWDWVKGYPYSIQSSANSPADGVRLVANDDCKSCPMGKLTECCSFHYKNVPYTKNEMEAHPELFSLGYLALYIAGMIEPKDIPNDEKTYYCIGSDSRDFDCGIDNGKPCKTKVNDKDRSKVTADYITRFTLSDLIKANGGRRYPTKKFNTIRHAAIFVSSRVPSQAEIEFYTLLWRHHEVAKEPYERKAYDDLGNEVAYKEAIQSWSVHTKGHSVLHSRLHGIDCGTDNLSVPSCSTGNGACGDAPCGDGAICKNFDGRPLCMCRDGLIGDGVECGFPEETGSYKNIETAYQASSHCFSVGNDWTKFIDKSQIPPYPGGTVPYSANSCGSKVCKPGWVCLKKKRKCISPTSKSLCRPNFGRSQCNAMGCCNFKKGKCESKPGKCPKPKYPSGGNKFLLNLNKDGVMVLKTCQWLKNLPKKQINRICNFQKYNLSKLGYKPARVVCSKVCTSRTNIFNLKK